MKALSEKYIVPSVTVVEAIKRAIDSPAVDILTQIIPGTLDDRIAARIRAVLPGVLQSLRISDQCLQLEDPALVVACAIENLKKYEGDARSAQLHSIAALLSITLADGKITWREAIHLAEEIYQSRIK